MIQIDRVGFAGKKAEGRWAHYTLVVNGTSVGRVRGTWAVGRDGLAGKGQSRWAAYEAGGRLLNTIAEAERHLIGRQLTVRNPSLTEDVARAALDVLEV